MDPLSVIQLLFFATLALGSEPKGPWDAFNYAPDSRTVRPQTIYNVSGSVKGSDKLLTEAGLATFSGNQSYVTLDFGVEVGFLFANPSDC